MSHYPITRIAKSNRFIFTTDSGHVYEVYFDLSKDIYPDEELDKDAIYMGFTSTPKQEKFNRDHDPKVGATVMLIVANMFVAYPRAIISYVCSPADGQARARSITFGIWHGQSQLKEKIKLMRKQIGDTYCGVLYSKKHPKLDDIELAFIDFDPENKFEPNIDDEDDEDDYEDSGELFP